MTGKLALVFGGGGARGIAHIGVWKVLQEAGVRPDLLVGPSIGALAAAEFGLDPDWKVVADRVLPYLRATGFGKYGMKLTRTSSQDRRRGAWARALGPALKMAAVPVLLFRKSLVARRRLMEAIEGCLPDRTFAECRIPVAAVAVDVLSTEEVIITEGSLRKAVCASSSLVGFFPPYEWGDKLLVDASPVASVAVDAARRLGAEKVVAVDLRSPLPPVDRRLSAADAIMRMAALATDRATGEQAARADVLIKPEVGSIYWSDFSSLDALVEAGEVATRASLDEIKKLVADG